MLGCRLKVNIRGCSILKYLDDMDVFPRGGWGVGSSPTSITVFKFLDDKDMFQRVGCSFKVNIKGCSIFRSLNIKDL